MVPDFKEVNTCKLCGKNVEELNHFYREHKVSQKKYFEQYWPRIDFLTKEKREYVTYDDYFLYDFNHKDSLKKYYLSLTKDQQIQYIQFLLEKRRKIKNLSYFPGQVELRSLKLPSFSSILKILKPNEIKDLSCHLSLTLKYDYNNLPVYEDFIDDILIDTREQETLRFPNNQIHIQKLDYGDYGCKRNKIRIERKSLADFIQSFGVGTPRLEKEITRAKKDGGYIVVCVEAAMDTAMNFKERKAIYCKNIKITPEYVFHNVRAIMEKYDNIQFLFLNSRDMMVKIIPKLLSCTNIAELDLQYLYDSGTV